MRRWMKFSIMSGFFAVGLVALGLGWIISVEQTQKRAEKEIYASGGETRWRQVGPTWLSKLVGRDIFAYVTHVIFIDVPVGAGDLKPVQDFHQLESLLVAQNNLFDGRGLEHTKGLRHLYRIDLYDVPVTNEGLTRLPYESLPALRELQIVGLLTDECLPFVKQFGGIKEVCISGSLTKTAVGRLNDEMPNTDLQWSGQGYQPR